MPHMRPLLRWRHLPLHVVVLLLLLLLRWAIWARHPPWWWLRLRWVLLLHMLEPSWRICAPHETSGAVV